MFRSLAISLLTAVTFSNVSHALTKVPTPSGDYCLDEGFEILKNKFGSEHEFVFNYTVGAYPKVNNNLIYVYSNPEICNGHFYLSAGPGVDYDTCISTHYGSSPRHLVGLEADKQCKELVPRSEPTY